MEFEYTDGKYSNPMLFLKLNGEVVGWVLSALNGTWTYDMASKYGRIDSPKMYPKLDVYDKYTLMYPHEESFKTKEEAKVALLKIFGE